MDVIAVWWQNGVDVVLPRRKDVRLCAPRYYIFEHVDKMWYAYEGGVSQDGDPEALLGGGG